MPLKWQSDQWDNWYYVKQKKGLLWIEYANGREWGNFTQVSLEYDANDGLVVTLIREGSRSIVKLCEDVLYWGSNLTWMDKRLTSGYWVKSIILIILNLIFQNLNFFSFYLKNPLR